MGFDNSLGLAELGNFKILDRLSISFCFVELVLYALVSSTCINIHRLVTAAAAEMLLTKTE